MRKQATIQYWDRYERRADGRYFAQRNIDAFYVVDVLERPNGERVKSQLTNVGMLEDAEPPRAWPSWRSFWEHLLPDVLVASFCGRGACAGATVIQHPDGPVLEVSGHGTHGLAEEVGVHVPGHVAEMW